MTYEYRVTYTSERPDVWTIERRLIAGGWVVYCWTDNQEDAEHIAAVLRAAEEAQ